MVPEGYLHQSSDSIIRMEEKIERHWYAFYVRMHHEKKTDKEMGLFIRKSIEALQAEAKETGSGT